MVSYEKLTENWKLRGLKLCGLGRHQINTPDYIYQNDRRNKIKTISDFENETPTHISPTQTISKIEQKSQNRIRKNKKIAR